MFRLLIAFALAQGVIVTNPNDVVTVRRSSSVGSCDIRCVYVDADDPFNGNGTSDTQAALAGGVGRYNNFQSALTNCAAGDTIILHDGNYVGSPPGNSDADLDGAFHAECSGTSAHYVTVKNAPGETPVIRPCSASVTALSNCNGDTLTFVGVDYWRITDDNSSYSDGHIKFIGRIHLSGPYPECASKLFRGPIELSYLEIEGGYDEADSGNWTGIWIICRNGIWVHHNNIHDINTRGLSGVGLQSSASCISFYFGTNSRIEYNTCNSVTFTESQGGAFDVKLQSPNNVFRYNYATGMTEGVRENYQYEAYTIPPGQPLTASGNRYYGNVFAIGSYAGQRRAGIWVPENATYGDVYIYNNTFVGFDGCLKTEPTGGNPVADLRFYNNICADISDSNGFASGRVAYWTRSALPSIYAYNVDENSTSTGYQFGARTYSTLAQLVSGGPAGFGDGSVATTNFRFTNQAAGDFTLTPRSPAKNVGRVGGTSGGAVIDAGAFGVTSCVGHLCP